MTNTLNNLINTHVKSIVLTLLLCNTIAVRVLFVGDLTWGCLVTSWKLKWNHEIWEGNPKYGYGTAGRHARTAQGADILQHQDQVIMHSLCSSQKAQMVLTDNGTLPSDSKTPLFF